MTQQASFRVRVSDRRQIADNVIALELRQPSGEALPTQTPGAHIDVCLPDGDSRQYSLCGTDTWGIAALREPDGRGGSAWIHEHVHVGDLLDVSGPRNHFELTPAQRYIFIAGGIGITPIVAMIRRLESQGIHDWRLVYGGRTRTSMAFADELAMLGDRVTIVPQDESGLIDLDAALGTPQFGTAIYSCGPEPLLKAMDRACRSWPPGTHHVERFSALPVDTSGDSAFEVVAERSGVTVIVERDMSILETLEGQGISVPSSCGEGVCGTCETKVLEGDVVHRDAVLTEEERAQSLVMMICCSRAGGPRLVLDL
ncbi:PDR/VanB family oxidoreductase [soil metagenome]